MPKFLIYSLLTLMSVPVFAMETDETGTQATTTVEASSAGETTTTGENSSAFSEAGGANSSEASTTSEAPAAETNLETETEIETTDTGSPAEAPMAETNTSAETSVEAEAIDSEVTLKTITEMTVATDVFSSLEAALIAADLDDVLKESGPFTVFAPNDTAFAEVQDTVNMLLEEENMADLATVLQYHVVSGKVMAGDLTDGQVIETVAGQKLRVSIDGDTVMVGGATVAGADMIASNGVIHEVDAVLMPELRDSIFGVVAEGVNYSTLEAAIISTGLVEALETPGPYTLFAPDNTAFGAVEDSFNALLMRENKEEIESILKHHVVIGEFSKSDLIDGQLLQTLWGRNVRVKIVGDTVYIDSAKVTLSDTDARNGVVHGIDKVLLLEVVDTTAESVDVMPFPDVTTTNDVMAIADLKARAIIQGYPDGTFGPDLPINRAEFTKIVVGAKMDMDEIVGSNCFPDVSDEWFAAYVCTAKTAGVIGGYPDGRFKPADNVNMAESYKIIAETFFADMIGEEGALWYEKYIDVAMTQGFYLGAEAEIADLTTREQMAQMIYRALMKVESGVVESPEVETEITTTE